jgi:ankyrin repeat protein
LKGADVNKHTNEGITALDDAAHHGKLQCAKALIAAGADVHRSNFNSLTSLHVAIMANHAAVTQQLLEYGATAVMNSVKPVRYSADISYGMTALMMCTTVDTVKLLLAAVADVHVSNEHGDTCLHAVPVICLLIKAGADLHAVNKEGRTAAQLAH